MIIKKKKITKGKLVFIDTSVYINCALQEVEKLNAKILEKILEKINKEEIILIIPENIKAETLYVVDNRFKEIESEISNFFKNISEKSSTKTSEIISLALSGAKKKALDVVKQKHKKAMDIICKIFTSDNKIKIPLNGQDILAGMKRSLLGIAPSNLSISANKNGSKRKVVYIRDQDCITIESIVAFLKTHKNFNRKKFIICADDKDYFKKEGAEDLHNDIMNSLDGLCKIVTGYKNPLIMLKKEFKAKYTKEQIGMYEQAKKFNDFNVDHLSRVALPLLPVPPTLHDYGVGQYGMGQYGMASLDSFLFKECGNCGEVLLFSHDKCPKCGFSTMLIKK